MSPYHEVQDEVHADFWGQFQPVIQPRQQFSGLFDRLLEDNDDLHQFINCSYAPLSLYNFVRVPCTNSNIPFFISSFLWLHDVDFEPTEC